MAINPPNGIDKNSYPKTAKIIINEFRKITNKILIYKMVICLLKSHLI